MSNPNEFKYLVEEVRVFHRNLQKDNTERRRDEEVTRSKFKKLGKFRDLYRCLVEQFNKCKVEDEVKNEIRSYAKSIEQYFREIDEHLKSRIGEFYKSITLPSKIKVIIRPCLDSETGNMTEKFNLRTAASLLPVMDGTENVTKQLIDSIELYDALLDDAGKTLLTNYILKTRLSQSTKIRMNSAYVSNAQLILDLKTHFITKKSISALSKQRNCSIDEFGKSIEELLVDLTITQADGNQNAIQVLRGVNEKIAINAFANGLQNSELRTIIKSRNYSKLSDAIQGSEDEEIPKQNAQIFHMQGRKNFRHNTGNNRFFRNSHFSQQNRGNFSGNRGQNYSRNIRRGYNYRGYRGNKVRNNPQRAYYSRNSNENIPINNHETVSHNSPLPSTSSEPFF
ncbi:hypothetical protein JTB14_027078 [Gonioctena quinquepunctata]|nr:hypothetical protein JTB14_027078 [Gonioctena quinquepunctata]